MSWSTFETGMATPLTVAATSSSPEGVLPGPVPPGHPDTPRIEASTAAAAARVNAFLSKMLLLPLVDIDLSDPYNPLFWAVAHHRTRRSQAMSKRCEICNKG